MGRHGSSLNPRINLERAVVVELDAGEMCVEPEGARRSSLAAQECSLMQISAVLPIHSGSMHQESAGIKDRTDGFAHRPTRARLAPGVLPLDGLPIPTVGVCVAGIALLPVDRPQFRWGRPVMVGPFVSGYVALATPLAMHRTHRRLRPGRRGWLHRAGIRWIGLGLTYLA